MPKYIVTSPDGKDFEITAPEGATQDQVLEYSKQQFATQQPPAAKKQVDSVGSRMARGVKDPVTGLSQLLYNALPSSVQQAGDKANNFLAEYGLTSKIPEGGFNEMVRQDEASYNAPDGVDWARLAGNVASPANLGPGALLKAKALTTGGRRVAAGLGLGAAGGAMQPVTDEDYSGALGRNVLVGGLTGGALSGVGQGLASIIKPKASANPDVSMMQSLGVDVTPGQALGGSSSKLEQKLTSVPFLGSQIEKRRQSTFDQFSNAMFNKAGKPIGFETKNKGFEAIAELDDAVSDAYTKAIKKTSGVRIDNTFINNVANLSDLAAQTSNSDVKRVVDLQINKMLGKVTKADQILPETWKELDASLGKLIRDEGDFTAKNALRQLQSEWRQAAARSNPEQAKLFSNADAGYKNLLILDKAAEAAAKQDGVFSPNQLYKSAKKFAGSEKSIRQKTAPFLQEAIAAEKVIGNSVPDSGTAGRLAVGGGLLGSSLLTLNPMTALTAIGVPALSSLAYTPGANKALTGLITKRPQSAQGLANAVSKYSPYAGLLAAEQTK